MRKHKHYLSFFLLLLAGIVWFETASAITASTAHKKIAMIENNFGVRVGVYAINTNNNHIFAYRADQRFPLQSTFKLIAVAALLMESSKNTSLLSERIYYTKKDLIFWHPITGKYINDGMSLAALSEAAISYSDNTAANLILKRLGGPQFITNFARAIGNQSFRLNHYEPNLNSNPANIQDSATPKDMAISLQQLTLGKILSLTQRTALIEWMSHNTTGYRRIRAAAPIGWKVADKTGSGNYGIANDIGILWSPLCKPVILSIYTSQNKLHATSKDHVVAKATDIVLQEFAARDHCFQKMFS